MPPNPKHTLNASSDDEPSMTYAISTGQKVPSLASYIPFYLKEYVRPYHGDFCFSPVFHPKLVAHLMMEGFLPIACSEFLLPKLHYHRCVIQLHQQQNQSSQPTSTVANSVNASALHIGKQVRKKSKRFSISINRSFDEVVEACQEQHGEHCWLYPPLVSSFRNIHKLSTASASPRDVSSGDVADLGCGFVTTTTNGVRIPVRLISIELWNVETGALAAGELGYTVGSVYTSLTGFSREDSAGSIQLATLGTLLATLGFTVWDLGMEMSYKTALGSSLVPRDDFVRLVHESRYTDIQLDLSGISEGSTLLGSVNERSCRDILDSVPPNTTGTVPGALGLSNQQPPSKKSKSSKSRSLP